MSDFETRFKSRSDLIEKTLETLLDKNFLVHETGRPSRLMDAMRYSALGGGKRLRPFLLLESAALLGGNPENHTFAAAALELIHCYSLVHDDLPAMDDDDLRRGRPTTHKAFDEATAILCGDALLTLAFDVLSREEVHGNPAIRIELVRLFSQNAGSGGMIGGQMLDLSAEKCTSITEDDILTLQAMKTGALIRCACEAGAVLAGASEKERALVVKFGSLTGQAFQLADDILDVTSNAETMGKQTGKDANKGKGTLVGLLGVDEARKRAHSLLQEAIATLGPFGTQAEILAATAKFVVEREN